MNRYPPIYSIANSVGSNFHNASFNHSILKDLESFDHMWATKLSLARWLIVESDQHITSVPTGTHHFPTGNHRLTGLWYTVKYRTPIIIQIYSSCVIVSQHFLILWFVVHGGQHFPYWQNRFDPNSWDISLHNFGESDFYNEKTVKRSFWPFDSSDKFYCLIF